MAIDARRREKKLKHRKAKEKKRKALAQRGPGDLVARFKRTDDAPILHCWTTQDLWGQGMSSVLVSRELRNGNVAFVVFLVDMYCLGVKNVMFDIASRIHYDQHIYGKMFFEKDIVDLEPEAARKLVEGAVEYANELGLPPHRDYRKAKLIFGDIDADLCDEEFVYGKDGKPFFVAGPNDSPSRCNQIMRILADRCGEDGFHYVMPITEEETSSIEERVLVIGEHGELIETSY